MIELLKPADEEAFRQLFAIYASSINPREQKPEAWMRAMVAAPEYRVCIARADRVLGFSILFVPAHAGFALLEYMAVAREKRNHGFGADLFRRTVEQAVASNGARLPVVLEIDADREPAADRALRTRRANFYRRLGCVRIAGLRYQMPLVGVGAPPEMDLMVFRAEQAAPPPAPTPQAVVGAPAPAGAVAPIARADLKAWLETIYRDVYHCPPDDPRIADMLAPLPDPVPVD